LTLKSIGPELTGTTEIRVQAPLLLLRQGVSKRERSRIRQTDPRVHQGNGQTVAKAVLENEGL